MDERPPTTWCTGCDSEFVAGITTCPDCGTALVTSDEYELVTADLVDHSTVDLVVAPGAVETIAMRMQVEQIPHQWVDGSLRVPTSRRDDVAVLLDLLDSPSPTTDEVDSSSHPRPWEPAPGGPKIASIWRRLVGAIVDSLVLSIPLNVLMAQSGAEGPWALPPREGATLIAIGGAYEIATTALWGRTLGKAAAGTRVVTASGGRVGWRVAALRWFCRVPPLAATTGGLEGAASTIGGLWQLAIVGSILVDHQNRGLHDRIAGTLVVHTRRTWDDIGLGSVR